MSQQQPPSKAKRAGRTLKNIFLGAVTLDLVFNNGRLGEAFFKAVGWESVGTVYGFLGQNATDGVDLLWQAGKAIFTGIANAPRP